MSRPQLERATSRALGGFETELASLILTARLDARSSANTALAGFAAGVAANVAVAADRAHATESGDSLGRQLAGATLATLLAWQAVGGSLERAVRKDRALANLLRRTALTENANAFNGHLRLIADRNGDAFDWVWDAHLEACPFCLARHGRPITITGWPPGHPNCQCFASPFAWVRASLKSERKARPSTPASP